VFFQPSVVVISERFVEQPLIFRHRLGTQSLRDVECTTRQIVIELGEGVTARSGIEIFVLQRHCQTPICESQKDNRITQTSVRDYKLSMAEFAQQPPQLSNQYDDDAVLRSYLRWRLPAKMHTEIEPGLRRLGERAVTDLLALAEEAEASPPHHVPYDGWGRRVDRIVTSDAWYELDRVAASEGIVATA